MLKPDNKNSQKDDTAKKDGSFGKLVKLPKIVAKAKKRLGRGMGSGKGSHTSGRGQKGQKSRAKLHILFEGYKTKKSYLKRLPLLRGKGKFKTKVTRRQKIAAFKAKPKASDQF